MIRRHAVERARGYVTVNELCATRDALRQRVREILGDPDATGRKAATIFNGLGSKGSWGAMYRYAEAEYEDRSIVDLLEIGRDEDDTPIFGSPAEQTPAEHTGAKQTPSGNPSTAAWSVGTPVSQTAAVPETGVHSATDQAVSDTATSLLHARGAALGITVEGLDDY